MCYTIADIRRDTDMRRVSAARTAEPSRTRAMREAVVSYRKTTLACLIVGLATISATLAAQALAGNHLPKLLTRALMVFGWAAGSMLLLVAVAGLLVLFRYSRRG